MSDFEKNAASGCCVEEKSGHRECCGKMSKYSWRNPKMVIMLVGVVLLAAIVAVAILRDRLVNQPQWQVNVTGQGRVSYQPDIANVTLGVQIDKVKQAQEALKQMNDKMTSILAALQQIGVAAEDIQTQNYSLYPQYDYKDGTSIPSGYSANQQLVVKVKQIDSDKAKLPKIIAQATGAGANQVLGIAFDVSNLDELKQQARLKAMADARAKAGVLATAAGVRLGKVVGWWENLLQAPGALAPYYGDKGGIGGSGASVTPPVPSGNNEIIMELTLNYKVK